MTTTTTIRILDADHPDRAGWGWDYEAGSSFRLGDEVPATDPITRGTVFVRIDAIKPDYSREPGDIGWIFYGRRVGGVR